MKNFLLINLWILIIFFATSCKNKINISALEIPDNFLSITAQESSKPDSLGIITDYARINIGSRTGDNSVVKIPTDAQIIGDLTKKDQSKRFIRIPTDAQKREHLYKSLRAAGQRINENKDVPDGANTQIVAEQQDNQIGNTNNKQGLFFLDLDQVNLKIKTYGFTPSMAQEYLKHVAKNLDQSLGKKTALVIFVDELHSSTTPRDFIELFSQNIIALSKKSLDDLQLFKGGVPARQFYPKGLSPNQIYRLLIDFFARAQAEPVKSQTKILALENAKIISATKPGIGLAKLAEFYAKIEPITSGEESPASLAATISQELAKILDIPYDFITDLDLQSKTLEEIDELVANNPQAFDINTVRIAKMEKLTKESNNLVRDVQTVQVPGLVTKVDDIKNTDLPALKLHITYEHTKTKAEAKDAKTAAKAASAAAGKTETAVKTVEKLAQVIRKAADENKIRAQKIESTLKKTEKAAKDASAAAVKTETAVKTVETAAKASTKAAKDTKAALKKTEKAAEASTKAAKDTKAVLKKTEKAAKASTKAAKDTKSALKKTEKAAKESTKAAKDTKAALKKTEKVAKESTKAATEATKKIESAEKAIEAQRELTNKFIGKPNDASNSNTLYGQLNKAYDLIEKIENGLTEPTTKENLVKIVGNLKSKIDTVETTRSKKLADIEKRIEQLLADKNLLAHSILEIGKAQEKIDKIITNEQVETITPEEFLTKINLIVQQLLNLKGKIARNSNDITKIQEDWNKIFDSLKENLSTFTKRHNINKKSTTFQKIKKLHNILIKGQKSRFSMGNNSTQLKAKNALNNLRAGIFVDTQISQEAKEIIAYFLTSLSK